MEIISPITILARKFGPTTSIVVASQAVSAISLFALPILGLGLSDAYSIAIQVGIGPLNGLVIGVIYLLAIGRPNFSKWKEANFAVAGFSCLLTTIALIMLVARADHYRLPPWQIASITIFFGIGGIGLALLGIRGVRAACQGRPLLLAGCNIPSNAAISAVTLLIASVRPHGAFVSVAPAAAWMFVNVIFGLWAVLAPFPDTGSDLGRPSLDIGDSSSNKTSHAIGLIFGVITSTVFPMAFVSAVNHLKLVSASILFLASRIGNALIGVLINSVLLVRHNWNRESHRIGNFSSYVMALALITGISALLIARIGHPIFVSYPFILISWLASLSATPIVSREANSRRLGTAILLKSTVDFFSTGAFLAILFRSPTVSGFFGIYIVSQCITCAIYGRALGDNRLVALSVTMLGIAASFLLFGW